MLLVFISSLIKKQLLIIKERRDNTKEPIYRVVLRIIEVKEDAFREWLDANSRDDKEMEMAIQHFIWSSDIRPEVRRIYLTAKIFHSYSDAERCFHASLKEFDLEKTSVQYFKDIRIERELPMEGVFKETLKAANELTGG